jgi:hypothetical protein
MLKSAKVWCELTGITVYDPDGWDRKAENFDEIWNTEKISFNEFWERLTFSTTTTYSTKEQVWGDIVNRLIQGKIFND